VANTPNEQDPLAKRKINCHRTSAIWPDGMPGLDHPYLSRSVDFYYRVPLLAGLRTVTLNSWGEVVQVISSVSVPWRPLALLPGHMETPQDSG
jgi:hypothetical protein